MIVEKIRRFEAYMTRIGDSMTAGTRVGLKAAVLTLPVFLAISGTFSSPSSGSEVRASPAMVYHDGAYAPAPENKNLDKYSEN